MVANLLRKLKRNKRIQLWKWRMRQLQQRKSTFLKLQRCRCKLRRRARCLAIKRKKKSKKCQSRACLIMLNNLLVCLVTRRKSKKPQNLTYSVTINQQVCLETIKRNNKKERKWQNQTYLTTVNQQIFLAANKLVITFSPTSPNLKVCLAMLLNLPLQLLKLKIHFRSQCLQNKTKRPFLKYLYLRKIQHQTFSQNLLKTQKIKVDSLEENNNQSHKRNYNPKYRPFKIITSLELQLATIFLEKNHKHSKNNPNLQEVFSAQTQATTYSINRNNKTTCSIRSLPPTKISSKRSNNNL